MATGKQPARYTAKSRRESGHRVWTKGGRQFEGAAATNEESASFVGVALGLTGRRQTHQQRGLAAGTMDALNSDTRARPDQMPSRFSVEGGYRMPTAAPVGNAFSRSAMSSAPS